VEWAEESKKRAGHKVASKKRLVEASLAQQRVNALEHVVGSKTRANTDAMAAQVAHMFKGQTLSNTCNTLASAASFG
jgi:hypothetical protein